MGNEDEENILAELDSGKDPSWDLDDRRNLEEETTPPPLRHIPVEWSESIDVTNQDFFFYQSEP